MLPCTWYSKITESFLALRERERERENLFTNVCSRVEQIAFQFYRQVYFYEKAKDEYTEAKQGNKFLICNYHNYWQKYAPSAPKYFRQNIIKYTKF